MGSEGALGFITSAVMKLRPRPVYRSKATVHFHSLEDTVLASRRIAQAHLFPANCRLLDRREALFNGVVTEPVHVLLLGFESADVPVSTLLEQALQMAKDAGGTCPEGAQHRDRSQAPSGDTAGRWRQAFFEAPYLQSRLLSVGIVADTFETAIRWEHFFAFHQDLTNTLHQVFNEVAHSGKLTLRFTHVYPDGPAPYYTFIFSPKSMSPPDAWQRIRFAAADCIARHQATISHHHAVGRLHRPWLARERSPLFLTSLRAVKREVDPHQILNPGSLLPES